MGRIQYSYKQEAHGSLQNIPTDVHDDISWGTTVENITQMFHHINSDTIGKYM